MFSKKKLARQPLFLLGLIFFALMSGFYHHDLSLADETREAAIVLHMEKEGNYAVPIFVDQLFVEKPPLYYLSQVALLKINNGFFALTDVLRLGSLLWAAATLMALFHLTRCWSAHWGDNKNRYVNPFLAVAILASCNGFMSNALTVRTDIALTFFITLTALGFSYAYLDKNKAGSFIAALGVAGGFLTKGIVAIGLSGLIWLCLFPFFIPLSKESPLKFIIWNVVIPFLVVVSCAGVWIYFLIQEGGMVAWHAWFMDNSITRMTGGGALGHEQPHAYFYYLKYFFSYSLPWSFMWLWGLLSLRWQKSFIISLQLWVIIPLFFLSIVATKRPVYILPLLPLLALATTALWSEYQNKIRFIYLAEFILFLLVIANVIILPRMNEQNSGHQALQQFFSGNNYSEFVDKTVSTPLIERTNGYIYTFYGKVPRVILYHELQELLNGNNPKGYERALVEMHGWAPPLVIPQDQLIATLQGTKDTKYNTLYLVRLRR